MLNLATNLDRPEHPSGRLYDGAGVMVVLRGRQRACCEPLAVRRTRSGVAGGCRVDSARVVRCTAVAEVVAVVGLLSEIQSTILRQFGCICQVRISHTP